MQTIKVKTLDSERIDKYLSENTNYTRSTISKMIDQGLILLNDKVVKASSKIKDGDTITIVKDLVNASSLNPENIKLDIVYENENLMIINKESGMVVHPGNGNYEHTLVNALLYYTNNLSNNNDLTRPGIVHRIDKDTSGLLVVAKNNKAHELLSQMFSKKQIKRKYIALIKGVLPNNHISIDAPIGRDKVDRKKMAVTDKNGKNAITNVNVLKRYKNYTLVECVLQTGRTHQIRVHLAYIGYPIYNDPVYQKKKTTSFGQFLHSYEIEFEEPIKKEHLHFVAPLPKEFQDFLDNLEKEEEN